MLKEGAQFVGSVSQMEPYHSFSIFNFTAYGVKTVFEESGLKLLALRPSIDAVSLVGWWRHPGERKVRNANWHHESRLNHEIDIMAASLGWSVQRTNSEKLRYAGQLCFVATKATEN